MKLKYPEAKGPLVVHRLDMSTSGLMLIAKTKEVHKSLQRQFINRSVKKQYIAILDGIIAENEGIIDLPLRVDLDNRPQQMVCEQHGKRAITHWKVLERKANTTRIQFSPITGRTHQLRVHAAHPLGLNTAILGDDLYGTIQNRLHLHAETLVFKHPISSEILTISAPAEF
jgi:tRNA pseudouridine32 synthase/23S rRNA pseudouridine746 synthase